MRSKSIARVSDRSGMIPCLGSHGLKLLKDVFVELDLFYAHELVAYTCTIVKGRAPEDFVRASLLLLNLVHYQALVLSQYKLPLHFLLSLFRALLDCISHNLFHVKMVILDLLLYLGLVMNHLLIQATSHFKESHIELPLPFSLILFNLQISVFLLLPKLLFVDSVLLLLLLDDCVFHMAHEVSYLCGSSFNLSLSSCLLLKRLLLLKLRYSDILSKFCLPSFLSDDLMLSILLEDNSCFNSLLHFTLFGLNLFKLQLLLDLLKITRLLN